MSDSKEAKAHARAEYPNVTQDTEQNVPKYRIAKTHCHNQNKTSIFRFLDTDLVYKNFEMLCTSPSPDFTFCLLESKFWTFTRFFMTTHIFFRNLYRNCKLSQKKRVKVKNSDSSKQNLESGEKDILVVLFGKF